MSKAIKASSEMHGFCKATAAKLTTFFEENKLPLRREDLEPFFDVITEEVETYKN